MKDLLKTVTGAFARVNLNMNAFRKRESAEDVSRTFGANAGAAECVAQRAIGGKKRGAFALAFLLSVAAVFVACSIAAPQKALAYNPDGRTVEVSNVDELLTQIASSRMMPYEANIVLTNDINFNEFDPEGSKLQEIVKAYGSLTFGNKDNPFKGSFDGQGHYIIGLNYERDFWKPVANTGLFSFTQDAYIHDIHFRDCYIGADFRGGVLVGQAKNTHIESVRMEDCTISVTPANNSVSLITNAGIMGGIIAGEILDGSYMYDCTVQGGRAVNNSVVAVSGLGGEGLYLGALVGSAENSQIEYCRVLPSEQYYADREADPTTDVYADNYKYLTEVYNRYEVAIGAVAGQSVYAGGVVGYIKDVDVVDCFSTAWVHTWVANYVGVGAGNIGYVGGIAAHAKSDGSGDTASQIIRCHYASNMESYQYNALAVIPIIQSNVYLAGLVERDWEEDTGIYNSYFKRNDIVGKDSAIKPYPDGYVRSWGDWLGLNYSGGESGPSAQGFGYGPIVDDEKYADRLFWEGEGYDFDGDEQRYSTIDNQIPAHINKWIMDDKLGIPVHGDSVKATLDFPGAGDVTMSATKMGDEQVTADPYSFAVQGVTANETELTLTATVNEDPQSEALSMMSSAENEGFRFQGWFRNGDVTVNHAQKGNHTFFDPMVPPAPQGEPVYNDESDQLNLVYKAVNSGTGADEDAAFLDNDLFVAYYQAQVLLHDVDGTVLDLSGAANADTSDDWYNHQDVLPTVPEPVDRAGVDEGAKFLGWTTQKNETTGGGWPDVTTSELNAMKANGEFFEGGESIERPMDLYPVYASLAANINVIAEGHELDPTSSDTNVREGVVEATVTAKDGKYELGINGLGADGTLPEGYRFLGWYEVEVDDEGNLLDTEGNVVPSDQVSSFDCARLKTGFRISAAPTYLIPDTVDLTQKHAYIAKFEYEVNAWLPVRVPGSGDLVTGKEYVYKDYWEQNGDQAVGLFQEFWVSYRTVPQNVLDHIPFDPIFRNATFSHWGNHEHLLALDAYKDDFILSRGELKNLNIPKYAEENTTVTAPLDLDAIVSDADTGYDVELFTDFPTALNNMSINPNGVGYLDVTMLRGYHFVGVMRYSNDLGTNLDTTQANHSNATNELDWDVQDDGAHTTWKDNNGDVYAERYQNYYLFKASADVNFYDYHGNRIYNADSPRDLDKLYHDPAGWSTEATSTRKHGSLIFGDATDPEANPYTMLEPSWDYIANHTKPVGLGTVPYGQDPTLANGADAVTGDATGRFVSVDDKLYEFLGWTCPADLSQAELDHCFKANRLGQVGYVATSAENAVPYLLQEDDRVYRTMEIYPVYAEYDYDTTTNITRDTNLTDPADPMVETNHSDDGTMTLTLTADVDADTAAAYALTSWTVESPEGTVIDTIRATDDMGAPAMNGGTSVGNDNPTLVYTIEAGSHYVFVANYEANAETEFNVTYHTNAGATEVVAKHAGDALGKGPAALFEVPNAAFVGWSEQAPDAGEYLTYDVADATKMVDEYTIVERPMELWPVYRVIGTEGDQANVKVNSNIDDTVGANHRRATVKTAATPQGTQTYVALEADVVDGYKFIGWYKDYVDMTVDPDGKVAVNGTPVPGNRVTGEEMFAGNLYTAVYQQTQVYKVVYHFPDVDGADGPLIEGTDTIEFAAEDTSAFVQKTTIQKPVVGPDGNPVYNPDGTPQMEEVEVEATVVGGEQTASMEGFLSKKDSQGHVKELFKEWEWKQDGATVAWDTFCRNPIVQSMKDANVTEMHLYPVTHRLNALDQDDAPYEASNLVWQIDPAAAAEKQFVKIAFGPRVLYLGNKLTVHMDEVHYAHPEGDAAYEVAVNDKLVGLYDNFDFSKPTTTLLDEKATGHLGVGHEGDVVFEFDTSGTLTIDKTAPIMAAGSTFTFTVTECDEKGEIAQDAKSATVTMTAVDNGQGAATATETINVPWGYYKVVETSWGWRYSPTYQFFEGGMTVEGRPDNVVLVRSQGTAKVTNALANEEYLDGEDRAKNVFGVGRNPNENGGGQ